MLKSVKKVNGRIEALKLTIEKMNREANSFMGGEEGDPNPALSDLMFQFDRVVRAHREMMTNLQKELNFIIAGSGTFADGKATPSYQVFYLGVDGAYHPAVGLKQIPDNSPTTLQEALKRLEKAREWYCEEPTGLIEWDKPVEAPTVGPISDEVIECGSLKVKVLSYNWIYLRADYSKPLQERVVDAWNRGVGLALYEWDGGASIKTFGARGEDYEGLTIPDRVQIGDGPDFGILKAVTTKTVVITHED